MFSKTILAGVVALGALAGSVPAKADSLSFSFQVGVPTVVHDYRYDWDRKGYDHHRHTLSAKEVRRVLRSRGYRDITYVDRRGSTYQVHARDYRGRRVGLVVSARNAAIITAYRL